MVFRCGRLLQTILQGIRYNGSQKNYKKYGAVLLLGSAGFMAMPKKENTTIVSNLGALRRFLRSLRIGIVISFDYYFSMLGLKETSSNYEAAMSRIHQRAAERILEGCLHNGGLYIKLGQGLVALNHILPAEYLSTLMILHDKCLTRESDEVTKLFMQDFGKSPNEIFKEFNVEPIAAASLAQVYKAKTQEGVEVAVKVQYIDLQERFHSDVSTVNMLLKIIAFMHPSFNFSWVLDDLKENLMQELDFINEGKNAERCASELAHLKYVYVPKVYWDECSTRVLTTEFIDGIKIDDLKTLHKLKYPLQDINIKLFTTFGEQIFYTGFIHADPHPGNVLIRRDQENKVQIVLLDHGLYEKLTNNDRIALCKFWKSIVLGDREKMRTYSKFLGVDDYETFAEILTQRPLRTGIPFKKKASADEFEYMTKMAQDHFDKIMVALRNMPRSMLLVIRNLNTVRSIAKNHGDPVNRFTTFARLACNCSMSSKSVVKSVSSLGDRFYFEIKLWFSNIKIIILKFILRILHIAGRSPALFQEIA